MDQREIVRTIKVGQARTPGMEVFKMSNLPPGGHGKHVAWQQARG